MGAMQTPVLVLMNNPPPISQFDIRFEQPTQFIQRYSINDYIFKGLHKFFAHLVIIEFVHTEHDSALTRKRSRYLFSVHQPKRASHSLPYKISRFTIHARPYQLILLGKTAQSHALFQCPYRIIGNRI